jgi:hypothetical protein
MSFVLRQQGKMAASEMVLATQENCGSGLVGKSCRGRNDVLQKGNSDVEIRNEAF